MAVTKTVEKRIVELEVARNRGAMFAAESLPLTPYPYIRLALFVYQKLTLAAGMQSAI
jgi:hypothetical protein